MRNRDGGGSGQGAGPSTRALGANRGEAGIVLIYVDWLPTVYWCVVPALSRRVRERGR